MSSNSTFVGARPSSASAPRKEVQRSHSSAGAVLSSFPLRRLLQRRTPPSEQGENSGDATTTAGERVQIIKSLQDLQQPPTEPSSNLSVASVLRFDRSTAGMDRERLRLAMNNPDRCTADVAWLVGTVAGGREKFNPVPPSTKQYIDVLESSQPPSHLNVKPAPATHNSRASNLLHRSRSECDLAYVNLMSSAAAMAEDQDLDEGGFVVADGTQSERIVALGNGNGGRKSVMDKSTETLPRTPKRLGNSSNSNSSNSSSTLTWRRNRTILGSFPLFYKLSQSLGSLNGGIVEGGVGVGGRSPQTNGAGGGEGGGKEKLGEW